MSNSLPTFTSTQIVGLLQSLDGDLHSESLLDNLMRIALESGEAEKGAIVLNDGEQFVLACDRLSDRPCNGRLLPSAASADLPATPIRDAYQTGKIVAIDDVCATTERWASDPYILRCRPQSLLCVPLIAQAQVIGVLYLERERTIGAFAPECIALLEIACTQTAIALGNAQRHQQLESELRTSIGQLQERTRNLEREAYQHQQNEKRYEQLYENTPIMLHSIDRYGRLIEVNNYWLEKLGYSREEVIGRKSTEFLTEDSRHYAEEVVLPQFFRTGICLNVPFQFTRKDGGILDVLLSAFVERDESGQVVQSLAAIADITDRKRAEATLRERELRYRQILDSIADMVIVKEAGSRLVWANKAFRDYYGMTQEELQGIIDAPFNEPDYTLQYIRDDAFVFTTGQMLEIPEENVTRYDGAVRQFSTIKSPIRNENEEITAIVAVCRDISEQQAALRERKQAEELLQKSEASLAAAQRIAHVGNWEFDLATQVVTWSEGLFPIYGRNSAEWQPTYLEFQQQVHPDDWEPLERAISRAISDGIPYEIEHRVIRPDGSIRYAISKGEAVFNDRGQVIKLFGITQDITESTLTQIALRESEEKFRQLAESIQEIFFIHDAKSYELLYISPTFEQIIGIPEESIYENPMLWQEIVHPDDRNRVNAAFQQQLAGENFDEEYRIVKPNGSVCWLRVRTFPVCDRSGNICRVTGVAEDITDRKHSEAALQKLNEELESLIQERTKELVQSQHILQESEERFRQLAENIDRVFWLANSDYSQVLYVSPAFEIIWGRACEELYRSPMLWLETIHPEDRDPMRAELEATIEAGYDCEYRILRPDGEIRWIRDRAFPIRDESGQVYRIAGIAEDISDRKHTELLLRRQVATVEAALDGIAIVNGDTYIYLNEAHARIFGYDSPAELLNKSWRGLYYPKELQFFEQEVFPVLMQQKHWRGEVTAKRKNGTTFDEEVSLIITEDGDLICVCRDVSDRKQAEIALQESERFLQTVLDTFPLSVFWKDRESSYLGCNQNFAKDASLASSTEIIGKNDYDMPWGRSEADLYRADDLQVIESGTAKLGIIETQIQTDGSTIWLETNKLPLYNLNGEVVGLLGTYQNITDRKQAEAELRDSEERLRLALKAANQGLYDRNLQTGEVVVSPEYATMLGYDPYEFHETNAKWLERMHPEDAERVASVYQAYVRGELSDYVVEFRQQTKSGDWKWILSLGKIVAWENGLPLRMMGTHTDISDRKAVEEALHQSKLELEERVEQRTAELREAKEVAEAANRAKSTFLANMSHELRTPLNAILGFSQLLGRDDALRTEQQQQLGIINRSGEHLLHLINDILEMSKIEAGQISLLPINFDLYTAIANLQEMFALKAKSKGLALQIERQDTVPRFVRADENKLRQVLINLLSNAVKFTDSGSVSLEIDVISDALESQRTRLHFRVKDTGVGIDANELAYLFKPFVQTRSGKAAKTGTGLGLAISYQFVELMGGELRVSSLPQIGSSFEFDIPIEVVMAEDMPAQVTRHRVLHLAPNQPTFRILIAEDNVANRQLMVQMLEPLGFAVETVENGQQAIERWEQWQPDLIWMDIHMPVMDGYEATQSIVQQQQNQSTAKKTVIIALTASAFEEERARILATGCDDLAIKPASEEVILEKLVKHLGVQYLYAEEVTLNGVAAGTEKRQTLSREDLAVMPGAWLHQLHRAARIADEEALVELLEQVPSNYSHLASSLKELVDNFNLELIVNLTSPSIDSLSVRCSHEGAN
ncbi:PAS domain S-box protein [Pseudanabaena sp. PCC 6802]|uniref:PAS domain S-box protein n=1 Tax=Pseudanabaena sp. PCC 6802 TaxID=118173 RepID=UPI00034D55DA|nr:PAS domain S-box protein [Pseudanabaena sp. PCC 6802]